jgi:hypothetical protein
VRDRRWAVTNVERSTQALDVLGAEPGRHEHLVTLASVEDDSFGGELRVVWELELATSVLERTALPVPDPDRFDEPARQDAFPWTRCAGGSPAPTPWRSGCCARRPAAGLPVVVLPYLNAAQAEHPAFGEGIERLRRLGVRVLFGPDVLALHQPRQGQRDRFPWHLTFLPSRRLPRTRRGNHPTSFSSSATCQELAPQRLKGACMPLGCRSFSGTA